MNYSLQCMINVTLEKNNRTSIIPDNKYKNIILFFLPAKCTTSCYGHR